MTLDYLFFEKLPDCYPKELSFAHCVPANYPKGVHLLSHHGVSLVIDDVAAAAAMEGGKGACWAVTSLCAQPVAVPLLAWSAGEDRN